eukprot:5657535-Amphidinium_carterae.1
MSRPFPQILRNLHLEFELNYSANAVMETQTSKPTNWRYPTRSTSGPKDGRYCLAFSGFSRWTEKKRLRTNTVQGTTHTQVLERIRE